MNQFDIPQYSKKDVVTAGKALAGTIQDVDDEAYEIFRIAHNWRSSHLLPMRRVRQELSSKTRHIQPGALTASRLKRMKSIRRKLKTTPLTLYQMQDVGGCRVVLNSIESVQCLVDSYRSGGTRHKLRREWDYISSPKPDGYRSHHMVLKFNGEQGDVVYNRQSIELQVRTSLQHAWATAVEAVGLVTGEDLKSGEGNADWLRLFAIMSSEFAEEEGSARVPGVSSDKIERRNELRDIDGKLDVIKNLESYNQIIRKSGRYFSGSANYYLIQYDNVNRRVNVKPIYITSKGSSDYEYEERVNSGFNTVLVEVEKVGDLISAFPNYFLDVQMFTDRLKRVILSGGSKTEQNQGYRHDLSFLRDWRKNRDRPTS